MLRQLGDSRRSSALLCLAKRSEPFFRSEVRFGEEVEVVTLNGESGRLCGDSTTDPWTFWFEAPAFAHVGEAKNLAGLCLRDVGGVAFLAGVGGVDASIRLEVEISDGERHERGDGVEFTELEVRENTDPSVVPLSESEQVLRDAEERSPEEASENHVAAEDLNNFSTGTALLMKLKGSTTKPPEAIRSRIQ